MRSHFHVGVLAGLLLAASAAMAATPTGSGPFDLSTPQSFHEQAALVRAGLSPRGAYGFLSTRDRAQVEQAIAVMGAMFQRYGNIEAMDSAGRVKLYNAQESANRILTRGRSGTTSGP